MKSKKKIVKRTTAVFGLAAVPTAAALGLAYGIRDEKIDLRLSPAHDFGERYFDNKIVKVNDDEFASNILYDPIERSNDYAKFNEEDQKEGDISGLVRLDRKIDSKYTRSLVNIDDSDTSQGKINVDGGLVYEFKGIKDLVTTKSGKKIFGKDLIKGMEEDAKAAITKAIYDFKVKNNSDENDKIDRTQPLRMGVYFEKNVIDRTVSIYLYELKDFDPEQNEVIHNFISTVESHKVDQGDDWIKTFRYNVWNYPSAPMSQSSEDDSYDRIDGLDNLVEVPDIRNNLKPKKVPTGFPEIFAGQNLMTIGVANNWYQLGGIADDDQVGLSIEKDGKIGIVDYKFAAFEDFDKFKQTYPKVNTFNKVSVNADKIIDRIKNSKYISANGNANKPMLNFLESSTHGHEIGPIQFAEKGIVPFIQPIVDYKNKVLKLKYTFKAFRKLESDTTRSVGTFNMGDEIENPYEICTYIKEIPLEKMGNEGRNGNKARIKIGATTGKYFQPFYVDDTTNIDPKDPEYNSLKASVVSAMKGKDGNHHSSSQVRIDNKGEINIDSAKEVLKDFLVTKTPAFSEIPIVGPGMGILGQMIPPIAASIQSWMDIGTMTAADPTISNIYTPELLDQLIENINNDPIINPTEFINSINSFTKEAWSDLNSLINLSGKVLNGERTSRTFQLFHLLAAFNDISQPIFDAIKKNNPDAYMGNNTSVIDQLMSWLKKNGIINSNDSLMDIIDNYKDRLGTIVETIGINRPTMLPDLVQQLVDLVPLPLFSEGGSQFNRDTAAVLEALLNGKYIKPNSDNKNEERILPAIIALLNGGQRTSVQTFFKHILNDKPADLMKFVLGVIGADFSKGDTFAEAIKAIWTMFETKVPDYVFNTDGTIKTVDKVDDDGKPVTTASGAYIQVPVINKNADGKPKMIMNPTFGGIGVALEKMYTGGIHSIPRDSYDSVLKFIFGTVASVVDMGTLSQTEETAAAQGIFDFVTNGAGHHKNPDGTISETTPADVKAIIRVVNAIANKEIISPDLGPFIIAILKTGVGSLSTHDIEPLTKMLLPKLQPILGFDKNKMTSSRLAEIFHDLFTGYQNNGGVDQLVKDIEELIPGISGMKITAIGGVEDLLKVIYSGKYPSFVSNPALSLAEPNLKPLQNILTDGLGNLNDEQWGNVVSGIRSIMGLAGSFIHGDLGDKLRIIFGSDESASAFVGVGHLISQGAGTVGAHDISMILELVNRLDIGFKLPDGTKPDGHKDLLPDGKQNPENPDVLHSLSFMIENILQNGVELSTLDIDTIMNLADIFGGSKFASIINTINAGNPEQLTGPKTPQIKEDAVKDLLIDFIVGYKYVGHPDLYAKDKVSQLKIPQKVQLLKGASKPGKKIKIHVHKPGGDEDVLIDNPAYWDDNEYLRLVNEFNNLKTEIQLGYKNYKDEDHHGDAYTPEELFEKLIRAQSIPNELEAINSKIDAANAKVKIFYDALAAFKAANVQIQSVSEVKLSSTLSGDEADYAKSIDALFKLLKTKMLAASSEATFLSLHGGVDEHGKHYFQTGTIVINAHKKAYIASTPYLEKLNALLTELNAGPTPADFITRMTSLYAQIKTDLGSFGVVGKLPGVPAWVKTKISQMTVGSDSDANANEVSHKEGGLFGFGGTKVIDKPAKPSTAAVAFKKFLVDNFDQFIANSIPVFSEQVRKDLQASPLSGGHWNNPYSHIWWREGSISGVTVNNGDNIDAVANRLSGIFTSQEDKDALAKLVKEFKTHIS